MKNTEDQKILKGIAAGDEQVLTLFYKKNLPYIRRYILQNSGNEEDVEDVFQDALVMIYQKLKTDSLELQSSLRTFFYAVCKNIWRNRLRKNKKIVLAENIYDTADTIELKVQEDIENSEREHIYRKYFLKLSDSCREVLNLLFQGNSMKEIAKITGYTEGYTRKKKFECKESLIEMIEKDTAFKELQLTPQKNSEL
ncbi:sigma-70 family RNA polymerase sigma factor [Aquimarina sp. AD10]|uniref:RNA polymerase sigma-70 region 2 domain-containing protein n=1 Tax=Aquimarina aggregata TaxID=1642818 RepID=A0A163B257_9FLAO|nr:MULTISPECIES: sigma-70 family RNA polymerase sigma factor [Aquimarina]AXT62499.1 sigma-70 family RNA polymerase sigma factor [Aquimarina sp. AD10]KZS41003.1 hypothetical protein AWE51_23920 [Aquimarina aggregata]RKM90309.1 sigma-70 family RNA polymerase sigma factor [Aquimarina sp. AD10]